MRTTPWPLAALAVIALVGAGCSDGSAGSAGTATGTGAAPPAPSAGSAAPKTSDREKGVKFAACMRDNGVAAFPDPDASGELTIDGIVNGSSLDTDSPAWKAAIGACRDLQPSGFTGHTRSADQQAYALKFAQCMRDSGVKDFPDPTRDGALIDTNRIPSAAGRGARSIPGFDAATRTCMAGISGKLGLNGR